MSPSLTCRGHWLGPLVGSLSSPSPDTVTWIYTKMPVVGSWTVIQRRQDGSVDFYRPWFEYVNGFGNYPDGEFWIGLETLHTLTSSDNWTLRFELEDWLGEKRYASYTGFYITNRTTNYSLMYTLGSYSGDAGDGLAHQHGKPFSTFDADHDSHSKNCAVLFRGAWWFNACHVAHLNGQYFYNSSVDYAQGLSWYFWKGYYSSLKFAEMKIRRP